MRLLGLAAKHWQPRTPLSHSKWNGTKEEAITFLAVSRITTPQTVICHLTEEQYNQACRTAKETGGIPPELHVPDAEGRPVTESLIWRIVADAHHALREETISNAQAEAVQLTVSQWPFQKKAMFLQEAAQHWTHGDGQNGYFQWTGTADDALQLMKHHEDLTAIAPLD